MESNGIKDLKILVKNAREYALLGAYHRSLETFKKIFPLIDKRMKEISDNQGLVDDWKNVKNKLKSECSLIFVAYQNCKIFSMEDEEEDKKKIEEEKYNNKILMRENKPKLKNHEKSNRWEHFGGKPPFSYLKENKKEDNYHPVNKHTNDDIVQINNYVVNHNNNNYKDNYISKNLNYLNNFYDDPDVWASPEVDPRFPYQKSDNKIKKLNSHKFFEKSDLGVVNEKNVEKRRQNYERPWQITNNNNNNKNKENSKINKNGYNNKKNLKNKNDKNDKKLPKGPPKSPFLQFRYPETEGNGPDTELIEMVEREVLDKNPNVSFDDIAELETAKRALTEAVVLPLLMPDFFVGIRRPWKGVLLYGPPGTGKTLLAKALATQGKTTFFNVSPTTFASKWKGESEKLVRILFEMARFYAPSTIFIDEVDAVGTKRKDGEHEASKKVLAEMLVQMDGISELNSGMKENDENKIPKFVMVLGATNLPWDLDDALRRRFEKRIYIPLPNAVGREQMFNINFKGINLGNDVDIKILVEKTEGYSGHDISSVCREASLMNMRRKLINTNGSFDIFQAKNNESFLQDLEAPISQNDIITAIKNISKSVSNKDVKKFEEWTYQFSSK